MKPGYHVARMVWTRAVHCVLVGKQQGKNHADRLNVEGTILLKYIWIIYSQDSVESDCDVEGKGLLWNKIHTLKVFMHHTTILKHSHKTTQWTTPRKHNDRNTMISRNYCQHKLTSSDICRRWESCEIFLELNLVTSLVPHFILPAEWPPPQKIDHKVLVKINCGTANSTWLRGFRVLITWMVQHNNPEEGCNFKWRNVFQA